MEERDTKKICDPQVPGQCKCEGLLNKLFLDTQGYCFMCLKEIGSRNIVNQSKNVEFCLRNINRYLNIDSTLLLLSEIEALEEESGTYLRDTKFDLSVNLCDSCYTVGENLSALLCQREKEESLLNCQLQTLHKSLETSHQGSKGSDVIWRKIQEKMVSGGGDPAEALVVGKLRQEIKEKCFQKIEKYHVSNKKLKLVDGGLPTCAPSLLITDQTEQLDLTFPTDQDTALSAPPHLSPFWSRDEEAGMDVDRINDKILSPEKFYKHPEPGRTLSPVTIQTHPLASNSFHKNTLLDAPPILHPYQTEGEGAENRSAENLISNHNDKSSGLISAGGTNADTTRKMVLDVCETNCKILNSQGHHECFLCKKNFICEGKVRDHLAAMHSEKFFLRYKLPSVSDERFKSNCKNFLWRETALAAVRQNTNPQNLTVFCTLCNERCVDIQRMRFHLLLEHYSVLEKMLINEMKTTESSAAQIQTKELSNKQFVLDVCRNNCMMIQVDGKIRYECAVCKQIFLYPIRTREHLAFAHPEQFFRPTKHPHLSEQLKANCKNVLRAETKKQAVRQSGTFFKSKVAFCRVCDKKCRDKRELRFHLILEHYGLLQDRLMNVKTKRDAGTNNQTHNAPRKYIDNQSTLRASSSVVCNYCHRNISKKCHLRRHQERGACLGTNLRRFWTCNIISGGCGVRLSSSHGLTKRKNSLAAKKFVSINSSWERRTYNKCNRKFQTRAVLRKHKEMKICFQNNDSNVMFDKSIPTQQKSLSVPKVQQNYQGTQNVINNQSTIRTSANVVCSSCHQNFSQKGNLRRHKKGGACPATNRRRFWTCNVTSGGCGAKLSSSYGLARHKRLSCPNRKSHITSQVAKKFVSINSSWERRTCDNCNRRFRTTALLSIHKKMKNCSQINDGTVTFDKSIPTHQKSLPLPPEIQRNHGSINNSTEQTTSSIMNTEKADKQDAEEWDKETFESVTCFCGKPFAGRKMIECQKCLIWYHFTCVGIHEHIPPNFQFQCRLCKNF